MRLCISIASILFVTTPAVAATVTVRPETPDRPIVVVVEGSLAAFDEDQFAAKTAPLSSAFVAFSSDGGSLVAGLRIGEAIRRKRFLHNRSRRPTLRIGVCTCMAGRRRALYWDQWQDQYWDQWQDQFSRCLRCRLG